MTFRVRAVTWSDFVWFEPWPPSPWTLQLTWFARGVASRSQNMTGSSPAGGQGAETVPRVVRLSAG